MNISATTPISAGGWRYNPADPQDRIDFEHHGADELEALERNRGLDFTDHPTRQSTTRERTILMNTNQPTADYGTLTDYTTGESIRPATAAEHAQSLAAGETGAFELDGRAVFVAGGPETLA